MVSSYMKNVRGIRNNNPANIRRGSSWKGLVPFLVDPLNNQRYYDKSFCQFESVEYGIRALFVLLRTYFYKYKLVTIEQIIHRFAPLSENNTYAYIAYVVRDVQRQYKDDFDSNLPNNLRSEYSFDYPKQTDVLNLFINPQTPSFICCCIAKSICKIESGYVLTDEIILKVIPL